MTNKCKTRMVQRELYNVRSLPNGRGGGGHDDDRGRGKKKGLTSSFVLCLIELDRSSHPQMVSSSPRIINLSSSMFLVPIQSSLTSTLTVVKLIKA